MDDLLAAESVLTRAWLERAPFATSHVGDLEWWLASAAPDALDRHLRLWQVDGTLAAWSWVRGAGVHWEIWQDDPSADRPLLEAILREAIDETGGTLKAWAPEDDAPTIALLEALGFSAAAQRLSQFQRHVDEGARIELAALPRGYRIRTVAPDDVPGRMAAHRAAFAPSPMNLEKYARLTELPHYRFEDDLIVEAGDGTIAAFAMAWWDPAAHVGEFEPVGTRPEHRRRGLGRALLTYGLRRYRQLGAELVQIYSHADNAASEALYQAVGFERRRFRRFFERRTAGG